MENNEEQQHNSWLDEAYEPRLQKNKSRLWYYETFIYEKQKSRFRFAEPDFENAKKGSAFKVKYIDNFFCYEKCSLEEAENYENEPSFIINASKNGFENLNSIYKPTIVGFIDQFIRFGTRYTDEREFYLICLYNSEFSNSIEELENEMKEAEGRRITPLSLLLNGKYTKGTHPLYYSDDKLLEKMKEYGDVFTAYMVKG